MTQSARAKPWWAPVIVAALAIAGAHPFCNVMFRCGCSMLGLTAHCNIHTPMPPHCPWCAQPAWFALAAALGVVGAAVATMLAWRKTTATLPSVAAGLVGVVVGGGVGAIVTKLLVAGS